MQDFQQNVSVLSGRIGIEPEDRMSPNAIKITEERLGSEMKTERVLLSNIQS